MYATIYLPRDCQLIIHSRSQRQRKRESLRTLSVLHNTAALDHSFHSTLHQIDHILCPGCRQAKVTQTNRQHSGVLIVLSHWTFTRHRTRSGRPRQIFPLLMVLPRSSVTLVCLIFVIDGIPSQYVCLYSQATLDLHVYRQPINQPPRSTSAQEFQPQTVNGHGYNEQDQGSVFSVIQSHQPAYENTQSTFQPSSFQQQTRGPRYSLPNPPSSSGFVPLNQRKQDSALVTRAGPTPAPGSYGITPSVITHHTGFVPLHSPTPAPSGFISTSSSLPFQPGYHNPHYTMPVTSPMPYGLPPPPMTIPPPQTAPQQQYPLPLPPSSSSPHRLASSPIPEHRSSPHTPSPPQDAYSQLQGEQPVSNPNSRPLPQPSITRRRSTLPVPPGGGGITISPTSSPSRPDSMYSGGNYQQPVQPIQHNNIPPPPLPLPSHLTASPKNQSHITGQAPPLPPRPPQHSLIHSHSHSHSLPNPHQSWTTNGQHSLPILPTQQNGQHNLPVPPVQQNSLPFPPTAPPPWRLALPQPPALPNPPTQQPIYVPPPPPLTSTIMTSYPNQLPRPPVQYAQHPQLDGYPPQGGGLYQQPTGTVWSYH